MPGGNHHHRSGSLRQSNKKNKRGTSSKRSLNRVQGGRINNTGGSLRKGPSKQNRHAIHKNGNVSQNKAKRQLLAKQRRETQRQKIINAKRLMNGNTDTNNSISTNKVHSNSNPTPKLIGVISLSAETNDQAFAWESQLERFLQFQSSTEKNKVLQFDLHKKNPITVLTNSKSFASHYYQHHNIKQKSQSSSSMMNNPNYNKADAMIMGALDLCRVCDIIIFTLNGDMVHETILQNQQQQQHSSTMSMSVHSKFTQKTNATSATTMDVCDEMFVSERGEDILSACKAQGLPTVLTILTHSESTLNSNSFENATNSSVMRMNPPPLNHREKAKIQKRRNEMKRFGQRLTTAEFGEDSRFMDIPIPSSSSISVHPSSSSISKNGMIVEANAEKDEEEDCDDDIMDTTMEVDNTTNTTTTEPKAKDTTKTTSVASHAASASTLALIRFICTSASSPPKWIHQMPRPYLMTSSHPKFYSVDKDSSKGYVHGHVYKPNTKELEISGYVRGLTPLCIYNNIHVPLLGTFAISKIQVLSSTSKKKKTHNGSSDAVMSSNDMEDIQIILPDHADEYQDSKDIFATPDALEGEQNLIGFDESDPDHNYSDNDDDDAMDENAKTSRPVGWSDYQSAWLDGVDTDRKDYDEDFGELANALNAKSKDHGDDLTMDGMGGMDDDEEEDEDAMEQKKLRRKEDLEFPDEVEVKQEESARDRFARYRSLKSFRKSYWDPKENLPDSYARVFHFASFKNTQKDILAEQKDIVEGLLKKIEKDSPDNKANSIDEDRDDNDEDIVDENLLKACVLPGSFVKITLSDVPESIYRSQISCDAPISAVSLLPHESKVSVIHMGITSKHDGTSNIMSTSKTSSDTATLATNNHPKDEPIKSKDIMIFRCGWRTWQGRPVFSQNNLNSDKHKLERFLPPRGAFFAGSVFGPVCYSPCPVLCFSKKGSLAAVGSVLGADADRIVIKRIILTGFPTRVHKRHATVKYMFYTPEDVKVRFSRTVFLPSVLFSYMYMNLITLAPSLSECLTQWFKPAGLTTKHGLQGNIMESVGDHGTMKCLFNQPVKQHDTICLPLYKRMYPKFAPQSVEDENGNVVTKDLVVL